MRKRVAKKLLDRCALEFCLGGYSRYVVPEHLACRAAVRLPGHRCPVCRPRSTSDRSLR